MKIIPAIDLKAGKCVRLRQGRFESATVFNDDPVAQALEWQEAGASRIHVVDLDGSAVGKPLNLDHIERIVKAVKVPLQVGGGIRDTPTIERYMLIGVDSVIIGTLAARAPGKVIDLIGSFPGRIAVGVDAKAGMVAVEGWKESTAITASELAQCFDHAIRPSFFVYTDIERDGMMRGPNLGSTREFARSTSVPVILSGGVSSLDDVRDALPLEAFGVTGMIIGRALYDGRISLKDAIRVAE